MSSHSHDITTWVGRSIRRVEDPALVAGLGRFAADLPAQRWVRFVRSPVAAGRIKRVTAPKGAMVLTMAELADKLSIFVTPEGESIRYVIDKTGLAGVYDFQVQFDADMGAVTVGPAAQAAMTARDSSAPGSGLPTIFKALEQQLGLRLVRVKDVPRDTIVIDYAERMPVGN